MKLFNPRAEQMLNGVEVDKPFNAMTLAIDLHRTFGGLECTRTKTVSILK
jgi:hypothetical protein